MAKHRGVCAFCGERGDLTKEDGYPLWINKVLPTPAEPGTAHNLMFETEGTLLRHDRRKVTTHSTEKFPKFCDECNNVWMSQLESEAMPILTPMMLGEPCELTVADQEVLGRWFTKTALVMEFKNPENRGVTDDALLRFGKDRVPFPNSAIYVAQYDGNDWSTNRARWPVQLDVEGSTEPWLMQLSTFCIWKLIFQVVFDTPRGLVRDDARYAIRIHPSDGEPKSWPPPVALWSEAFYLFATNDRPPALPSIAPKPAE